MLPQVNQNPALVQGYPKAVLTPNAMEFSRLVKAVLHREVAPSGNPDPSLVAEVAAKLGHVTILHKVSEHRLHQLHHDCHGPPHRLGHHRHNHDDPGTQGPARRDQRRQGHC